MHRCGCEWKWPPNRTFLDRNGLGLGKKMEAVFVDRQSEESPRTVFSAGEIALVAGQRTTVICSAPLHRISSAVDCVDCHTVDHTVRGW